MVQSLLNINGLAKLVKDIADEGMKREQDSCHLDYVQRVTIYSCSDFNSANIFVRVH